MEILIYLKDLLISGKSVYLPGIGSFVVNEKPAFISPSDNKIFPPTKEIVFNNDIDIHIENDILQNYIIHKNGVDFKKADSFIARNVKIILQKLKKGEKIIIEEIGEIYTSSEKIVFEPFKNSAITSDSYGLPVLDMNYFELESKKNETMTEKNPPAIPVNPVKEPKKEKKTKEKSPVRESKKSSTKLIILGALIPFLGATIFFIYSLGWWDQFVNYFESYQNSEETVITNDSIEQNLDNLNAKKEALFYKEDTVKEAPHVRTYCIIAGSFKTKERADRFCSELTQEGFTPQILNYSDTLFRVTIYNSQKRQDAVDRFIEIRNESKRSIWMLSY